MSCRCVRCFLPNPFRRLYPSLSLRLRPKRRVHLTARKRHVNDTHLGRRTIRRHTLVGRTWREILLSPFILPYGPALTLYDFVADFPECRRAYGAFWIVVSATVSLLMFYSSIQVGTLPMKPMPQCPSRTSDAAYLHTLALPALRARVDGQCRPAEFALKCHSNGPFELAESIWVPRRMHTSAAAHKFYYRIPGIAAVLWSGAGDDVGDANFHDD